MNRTELAEVAISALAEQEDMSGSTARGANAQLRVALRALFDISGQGQRNHILGTEEHEGYRYKFIPSVVLGIKHEQFNLIAKIRPI